MTTYSQSSNVLTRAILARLQSGRRGGGTCHVVAIGSTLGHDRRAQTKLNRTPSVVCPVLDARLLMRSVEARN
jgi:hypothetical protein